MSEKNKSVPIHRGPMAGGMNGNPGDKPKNFKKSVFKLLGYCKKFLPAILIALIIAVIGTIFTIIGPDWVQKIIDAISASLPRLVGGVMVPGVAMDWAEITRVGIFLVSIYGIGVLFNYFQGFIMATVTQKVTWSLRRDISGKINRLPLKYFDSTTHGDTLSRVTNDVDSIGQTLNQSIVAMITSVVLLVGVVIMMFINNWIMALSAIGASLIGFALMAIIMSKSQKYFIRQQQALGELNGHIEEIYSGHNVVKVFNAGNQSKQKFNVINQKLKASAWKSQFLSGMMMPVMNFIGNLGFVAVCVVGGALAFNGQITFGVIGAFMIYIRLFTQPLGQIAQVATSLQSTAAASERVFEFLEEKEMSDESAKTKVLTHVDGEIDFENVKFGYREDRIIINDFSTHVKAGQKIAIVGPTGAGKTTLVNLLMRFYETNSGNIKIDGVPVKDITRDNVHSLFGMVLQDTWIFEGTIKDNIVYSKKGVTDEQVISASKAAGLHHFIMTLPKGYDTVLSDENSLSSGQKQLITIARAMVENAPMLILDEATSSVDTRTEVIIQKAMDTLMHGRTSFVIAHRLSTIKNADLILVMKDGDIIESGPHDQLMEKKGFYSDLYNSQFENAAG